MFRTAALRSAALAVARRSATTTAARSFSSVVVSRPTLVQKALVAPVSRVASWNAVRAYSAGSGLSKEDVEGRILSLLAGFDKVRFYLSGESAVLCVDTGDLCAVVALEIAWWILGDGIGHGNNEDGFMI